MEGRDSLSSVLPFMQFDKFMLRIYTSNEIRKLSVLEINQVKTFDEAGFPIKQGLYDPALGCGEQYGSCDTCGLNGLHCAGHFGHIQLSVPIFNPLLFTFTYNLMRGSCIHCHKFFAKTNDKTTKDFLAKLKEYSQMLQKNDVTFKHALLKEFLRDVLFKRKVKCPHCKLTNGTLRNDTNRSFLLDFTGSLPSTKLKKDEVKKALRKQMEEKAHILESEPDPSAVEMENEDKKGTKMETSNAADHALHPLLMSKANLGLQLRKVLDGSIEKLAWRASEARQHLRLLWHEESAILQQIFPIFEQVEEGYPIDILFCESILVQPSKFRPIRLLRMEKFEHSITANLRKLMEADQLLTIIKSTLGGNTSSLAAKELVESKVSGKTMNEKLHNAYLALQVRANCLFDEEADKLADPKLPGLRQILEKKAGLFRMNMMGKRVNYACRSVITPDPYLDVDEIGIPELFARRLTFCEPTNYLNTSKLRELIHRGPLRHPGANFIQTSGALKTALTGAATKAQERSAFAARIEPGKINYANAMPTLVFRHLEKGDCLLMNRQPSLHKPSIMGHKARILKGQKALRMNYAPCKAYNADFDGDEMNGHFPQNMVAQAEVGELADVGTNYLVPKDGTPILGLIQDHVISGVMLTMRGRFLNKKDFMYLVFSAFAQTTKRIRMPPPAMLKPEVLYSGKQVITAIITNIIPEGRPKINLTAKAKTSVACWKVKGARNDPDQKLSESVVIFRSGELLCGVLDKQHYGTSQYSLIHCCYELYGPKVATTILSCFSRVFTTYLQLHGFSLGVADILVEYDANRKRRKIIKEIRKCGVDVVKKTFNLPEDASALRIKHVLATAYNNPRKDDYDVKQLDYTMKQTVAKLNEQINDACVPKGLVRSFPQNALQLMIQSGAKGTLVNSIQISCALGQIELEGKRPPLSAVGRTLPSFRCFDPSPRAGGFVDQRFLTGLNPQELFFHTMAGREGLVDTAVKTSRSGYLQRCIIKHMEGLSVRYDHTVRDHDNSVVQFRYGEDGLDVGRATFLKQQQFSFIRDNEEAARQSAIPMDLYFADWNILKTEKQFRRCLRWQKKKEQLLATLPNRKIYESGFTNFCKNVPAKTFSKALAMEWASMTGAMREQYESSVNVAPESVDVKYNPATNLGALPEKVLMNINSFIGDKQEELKNFKRAMFWKGLRALADPGENVGLLAAQSIGEPSTQMTLNTFHFAGRGDMNVTLGIPRLREILMTASKNISTPTAQITIFDGVSDAAIEQCKNELNPVFLKNVVKRFMLEECVQLGAPNDSWRRYKLTIELLRNADREANSRHLSRKKIMSELEKRFAKSVASEIGKRYKDILDYQQVWQRRLRQGNQVESDKGEEQDEKVPIKDDGASSDEEADGGKEADAADARLHQRHLDDAADYEGEDEEHEELLKTDPNEMIDDMEEIMDDSEVEDEHGSGNESDNDNEKSVLESRKSVVDQSRIDVVTNSHYIIAGYKYDARGERWCSISFQLPLKNKSKLDVTSIVEAEIGKFVVSKVPRIEKCVVSEESKDGKNIRVLQTLGINVEALFKRADILDVNTIHLNDLDRMLNTYGVEACGRAITKEMTSVFGVYGIEIDPRHLSLTADYMTYTGEIQPFSRGAMAHSASPLQRMTFEMMTACMRDAIINGEDDTLFNPSARLITGQLQRSGTGSFDLLAQPQYIVGKNTKEDESGLSRTPAKRKIRSHQKIAERKRRKTAEKEKH